MVDGWFAVGQARTGTIGVVHTFDRQTGIPAGAVIRSYTDAFQKKRVPGLNRETRTLISPHRSLRRRLVEIASVIST